LFASDLDTPNMRKPAAAALAPGKASLPAGRQGDAAVELVCLALALAVLVLACRIAAVW
jgi:hypothetical protein